MSNPLLESAQESWVRLSGLFTAWHLLVGTVGPDLRIAACGARFRVSATVEERSLDDPPRAYYRCQACQGRFGRLER